MTAKNQHLSGASLEPLSVSFFVKFLYLKINKKPLLRLLFLCLIIPIVITIMSVSPLFQFKLKKKYDPIK